MASRSDCSYGVFFAQTLVQAFHCRLLTGTDRLWYFSPSTPLSMINCRINF